MNRFFVMFFLAASSLLCSCSQKKDTHTLRVAATPVPHAQMLQQVQGQLQEEGIALQIITMEDYNLPNRALEDKELDANFFQHMPFLEEQNKQFHYHLCPLAQIHIEPMGIYSCSITSIQELKPHATIAIPNDPSNEARALLLLQKEGVITLKQGNTTLATVLDIASNPKEIRFSEIDAAMLPRVLSEVDAAVINTNFALEANLNPAKDAIAREDSSSPYVNIIAVRCGDENRPDLQALKKAMTSEKMKQTILEEYKGAIIPAFTTNNAQ